MYDGDTRKELEGKGKRFAMNRTVRSILLSLFALTLSGCGSTKPIRYYTIQSPTAPALSTGKGTVSLVVASIGGPEILRGSPIAYRVGANEIGTYQYSQWEEPPTEMIQNSLIRLLRESGNYQSVESLSGGSDGQFVVRGRLNDFEEVDGPAITGLVSMEFELYDRKSGKVVWTHSYSQSEPANGKDISAIVSALDVNLDRGLKEVAAGIDQYFSTNSALATGGVR
jgi:cholesterol transport system auxiliary component